MHKIKLAFRLEEDDRFAVMTRAWSQGTGTFSAFAAETIYDHEDLFLKLVIYADLDEELTRQLVVAVILSVADSHRPTGWIAAEISDDQNEVLGLNLPPEPPGTYRTSQSMTSVSDAAETNVAAPFASQTEEEHFQNFLMNAPKTFAMLTGAEHTGAPGPRLPAGPLDRFVRQEHHKYRS